MGPPMETEVSKLIAPAMPFLSESLHRNLVNSVDENAPDSVHLARCVSESVISMMPQGVARAAMKIGVSLLHQVPLLASGCQTMKRHTVSQGSCVCSS